MDIFKGLEKIINEHGSAPILKERLLLAADQFSALEKENDTITQQLSALESENTILKFDNIELNKKINAIEKPETNTDKMTKEQENILKFVFEHESTPEGTIVLQIGLSLQGTRFHLTELKNLKFLHVANFAQEQYGDPTPPNWSITQEGRKYLFENGLLT